MSKPPEGSEPGKRILSVAIPRALLASFLSQGPLNCSTPAEGLQKPGGIEVHWIPQGEYSNCRPECSGLFPLDFNNSL